MLAEVPDFGGFAGGTVRVGSRRFLQENGVADEEDLSTAVRGKNLLYVARDKKLIGIIGIEDPIRPKMKKTLNQMRRCGVDEIVMLTGDAKAVAAEVARAMDVDSYHAEILPEDKSRYVNQLKQRGTVMMVGDGINDAPALAFADVGVSLGGRQTDIAAESSAVTIHSEDPRSSCGGTASRTADHAPRASELQGDLAHQFLGDAARCARGDQPARGSGNPQHGNARRGAEQLPRTGAGGRHVCAGGRPAEGVPHPNRGSIAFSFILL